MKRRILALGGLSVAAAAVLAPSARAQGWPTRPITVVVPVAAGGAADALARAWGDHLTRELGKAVVIDNRAGANGGLAAAFVAKQPADGHTLLFGSTSNMSLNQFSYKKLGYDATRDFDPVVMLATTTQVLVASTGSGIKSVADLTRRLKARPDSLNFGSAGVGNSTHLNVEFLLAHFGVSATHVPYRGAAPAMQALLAGETQFGADALVSVLQQLDAGKVVPLMVFSPTRIAALPQVPSTVDVGLEGFPGSGWYGVMAPKGTPRSVIDALDRLTQRFWADPQVRSRLDKLHMERPPTFGADAVTKTMAREARIWGPVITRLGIQND